MKYFLALIVFLSVALPQQSIAADFIDRRDGFLLIWKSISRPAETTREKPYLDVGPQDPGFLEITYAKARGILNDENVYFRPSAPLTPSDALLLLFRTRNVERLKPDGKIDFMELPNASDLHLLAEKYTMPYSSDASSMTRDELLSLMKEIDEKMSAEIHEASLYSEKFHGKGTAFGETFDMHALTAAHRSFPHNTLVRVTNIANNKNIVVRINDRGPFVQGRNMDLSLRSFTEIADRSLGKIRVRFERMGDKALSQYCNSDRLQRRITRDTILNPGIPHSFALGSLLKLQSDEPFVLQDVLYPDGSNSGMQTWVTKGETYELTPSVVGTYRFILGTKTGQRRTMAMEVVDCAL